MRSWLVRVGLLAALLPVGAATIAAQGVTTGAVRGTVVDGAGAPIAGAQLTLLNTVTGFRTTIQSRTNGTFALENVTPGGPFVLSARAIGYRPASRDGIVVTLGQVVTVQFVLEQTVVELGEISVTAEADPLLSRGRTGAAVTVSESFLDRIPSLSRNFTDLVSIAPQVGSGTSVAGQNNRFNNIQIDGGVNNDLFGLGSTGTPGGQVNSRPISMAAIKEFQVLIAPFDVRQGGFTGGLINAITKSGSNEFHGSLFAFGQNQSVARSEVDRGALGTDVLADFHEYQYGGTLSGPIIRDRLNFFAAVDIKERSSPFAQYLQGDDAIDLDAFGVTQDLADRVTTWSLANLGDPGTAGQVNRDTPDKNIFGKINAQLSDRGQLEASFNYVKASDGSLIRSSSFSGFRSGYELGNAGYTINNSSKTGRLRWNQQFGSGITNELLIGYQRIRDLRNPGMNAPLIFVGSDGAISIGAERFSQGNELRQDVIEVSNNLTFAAGSHLLTLGTHNEFFKFYNQFFPGSYGVWAFEDADALEAGTPYHYEIALPLRPGGPLAEFKVNQIGFYAQDVWTVSPKLSLTFGLRVDAPLLPTKPDANAALAAVDFAHVNLGQPGGSDVANTSAMSTGTLWSPRFGFNYDVRGDRTTLVRGGVGVFSGRPPYVWVSNAFANSGLTQALLSCNDAQVPTFVTDIAQQPTSCAGGGEPSPPVPSIVYFDPGFKFPQTMRAAFGVDHDLGWNTVGTVDVLYTRSINQFALTDVNIEGVQRVAAGEGGREMYGNPGTPNASGIASTVGPKRVSSAFRDVIRNFNSDGDRSYSVTVQATKRFTEGLSFTAGYTHANAKDKQCFSSSVANSNMRFTVLQGRLNDRELATSCFDVPHKVTLTGVVDAPLGLQVSLSYTGRSGTPFTYTTNSDANGDGFAGNDPIYVPAAADDISLRTPGDWATLDEYISNEPCLDQARGSLLERNACRGPWQTYINARITKVIPTFNGQMLELSLDIFNLPNLLNADWGVIKATTFFENQPILNGTGFDVANDRNQYTLMNMTGLNAVSATNTRYQLLFSGKYVF